MRKSKAQKQITHENIVKVAAKRFRERGIEGIGLVDIMQEAGLKFGGFYKHFDSRDDLVIEALEEAFHDLDRLEESAQSLPALLDDYLSEAHRDDPGTGCALTALAGDVRHASSDIRDVFTDRVKHTLDHYSGRVQGDPKARRAKAVLLFSAAVGGLTLARAVSDPALSSEILSSLRSQLAELTEPTKLKPARNRS